MTSSIHAVEAVQVLAPHQADRPAVAAQPPAILAHPDRLDPQLYAGQPFFAETITLFRCVRTHDFETLAALCEDDFGIVDLDTDGSSVAIPDRVGWEAWFTGLFGRLGAMAAETDTEILDYQARASADLGYSVVRFRQWLYVGEATAKFTCIATIIWKLTDAGWREARWHCSLLNIERA